MKYSIDDLLLERENRMEIQQMLINKFNMPLLVIKANYPGLNKQNDITNNIVQGIDSIISDILEYKIKYKLIRFTAEGPVVIMIIDMEPRKLKKITIEIEEKHILGRIADIDVYDRNNNAISRRLLGYDMRKCYLCDEYAHVCVRMQKHSINEIIEYISKTYNEYVENVYGK